MTTTYAPTDSEISTDFRYSHFSPRPAANVRWHWFRKSMDRIRRLESTLKNEWDSMSERDRAFFRMMASGMRPPGKLRAKKRFSIFWEDVRISAGVIVHREETLAYLGLMASFSDLVHEKVAGDVWKEATQNDAFDKAAAAGGREILEGKSRIFFDRNG